jgi:hypothetical protein
MDFDVGIFKGKVVTLEKTFPTTTYRISPFIKHFNTQESNYQLTISHFFGHNML